MYLVCVSSLILPVDEHQQHDNGDQAASCENGGEYVQVHSLPPFWYVTPYHTIAATASAPRISEQVRYTNR
jgi:hypothetical protein